jgi:hypothetical protein
MAIAAMALAGCTSQMVPAQRSISEIDATLTAAASEAAKYIPEQLTDARRKLDDLKASFAKKDYAAVLEGAPAVKSAAQGLGSAAAAKKAEIMKALNEQWAGLAAVVPEYMWAIQGHIDQLSKSSARKPAPGIDLDAARGSLSDATSLWSKSQAAFATGNLAEAVTTAQSLKTNLEGLASTLRVDLTAFTPKPASGWR